MNAVIIEHVPVAELPEAWRAKLSKAGDALVTVRIEAETAEPHGAGPLADNPLFGMWSDREDLADVAGYVRGMRADRFGADAPGKD